jgi:hypothetical protein
MLINSISSQPFTFVFLPLMRFNGAARCEDEFHLAACVLSMYPQIQPYE